jgi:hypothetical protein
MIFGRLFIIYPFSGFMWKQFRTSRIKQEALLGDGGRVLPLQANITQKEQKKKSA